jgi:hypothetical protein
MGVDNVLITGDLQTCDALGIDHPPHGIGDTLRVAKGGAGLELTWQASPTDETHDPAAYYELYVSATPDAGFGLADTTTRLMLERGEGEQAIDYFEITAVNAAGSSPDAPAP